MYTLAKRETADTTVHFGSKSTSNPLSYRSLSSGTLRPALQTDNPLRSSGIPTVHQPVAQMMKWKNPFGFFKKKKKNPDAKKIVTQPETREYNADEDYITAYRKARLYHGTKDENVEEIEKNGLLTEKGGEGQNNSAYREGRVFLGWDKITSEGYSESAKGIGRVFLPPERSKANFNTNRINEGIVRLQDHQKGEMYRDPENPAAYFTEKDIAPEQIQFSHDDRKGVADAPNFGHILGTISQHMENRDYSSDQLKIMHLNAVEKKRISFIAGDVEGSKHLKQIKRSDEEVDKG